METFFEIFQSIEALGIIIFSLVSAYYGVMVLAIHWKRHNRLLSCCWIILIQTISQLLFFASYTYILITSIMGTPVIGPTDMGAVFIRPTILINNIIIAVYLKIRFINEKNIGTIREVKNG